MRQAAKIDANHREIVYALRKAGASVQSLASVGKGCPDLLVGKDGQNILMEVKDGNLPPSRKRLTDDEKRWNEEWRGFVYLVESIQDALKAISG